MLTALIAGIDSEIGSAISMHLQNSDWKVIGTSRRLDKIKPANVFYCDFSNKESIDGAVSEISIEHQNFDVLIIAVGVLDPIGSFEESDPDNWEQGFYVNALGPIRFIRGMIPYLDSKKMPLVISFAGGGVNSAPSRYSSYTNAKIALTKSMEIIAAEIPRICFVSLGTGWIKSPIHMQTLAAGENAGLNRHELLRRIENNEFGDIDSIGRFVLWAFESAGTSISGRNFSLTKDAWGTEKLILELIEDPDKFKLRRFGND